MVNDKNNDKLRLANDKKPDNNIETINEELMKGEVEGLKYTQIIENIREHGIKIGQAQYYRYKDKLFLLNQDRLRNMPNEYSSEYLKRIATYKRAEQFIWDMIHNADKMENRDKLAAIKQITDLQLPIQFLYNSSPIVNGMMDAIKDATTRNTKVLGTST